MRLSADGSSAADRLSAVKTILIVRLGALGDIVHALPAAAALRAAFPRARIDWLVDGRHREILDLVPVIDRRIVLGETDTSRRQTAALERPSWRRVLATIGRLRRERYDVAIDLQGLLKSAILARASGAGRVVGFAAPHLRERAARSLYTETHDPLAVRAVTHVIERNLALVEALGVPTGPPHFPIESPSSQATPAIRARLGLTAHGRFAVINPGAAWPNKRWPPDRLGMLAQGIRERHGLPSAVLWGPTEEPLAREVAAQSGGAAEIAPATTVADLVALMTDASLVVSGDTGPLHIAAAVGAPIVGIYGPTDPARNGPWSSEDVAVSRFSQCACHHLRRCRTSEWCLLDISLDEVLAAVDRRLASASRHV